MHQVGGTNRAQIRILQIPTNMFFTNTYSTNRAQKRIWNVNVMEVC